MNTVDLDTWLAADPSRRVQDGQTYLLLTDGEIAAKQAQAEAEAPAREAARKAALEAAYHGIVAGSICNLQSQMAWAMRPHSATKVAECLAWLDALWAQYHMDKASGATIPTFATPPPSYSFLETIQPDAL